MLYILAIAFLGIVAIAMVAQGARLLGKPESKPQSGKYFMLGAALMMLMTTLLLLQNSGT